MLRSDVMTDVAPDVATENEPQRTQRNRLRTREPLFHVALVIVAAVFAIPAFVLVSTALKTQAQNVAVPTVWIPHPIDWNNFITALTSVPFARFFENSVIITGGEVIGVLLSCSIVGYGFSLIRWRGRDKLFIVVISTMLIPYEVTLIPQYIIFAKLGWVNTFLPLIVPYFLGIPVYIFLFRQFFLRMPYELGDSARIDGASEKLIFWRIYLPLARPALIVVALLQFVAGWNNFLGPLIYLSSSQLYTLPLGMEYFRTGQYQINVGAQGAYALLIIIPVVIVFFLAQRKFIEGIALTGTKM